MSRGVKDLKRIIAEVRQPGLDEVSDDEHGDHLTDVEEQETFQSLRAKFEKLKVLSDADKEVISMLHERLVEQQNKAKQRHETVAKIQEKFQEMSAIAQGESKVRSKEMVIACVVVSVVMVMVVMGWRWG